jgi:hypothetical protein
LGWPLPKGKLILGNEYRMLNHDVCRKTAGNVASRNALKPRQIATLDVLASGGNMAEAAKASGTSSRSNG